MEHKLQIISLNKLDVQFWHHHISINKKNIYHFNNVDEALKRINKIKPRVILIDEYFSLMCNSKLQTILNQIKKISNSQYVYLLSPRFADLSENVGKINPSLYCYTFSASFLTCINSKLNENSYLKLTA